jgi:hypothetical protein
MKKGIVALMSGVTFAMPALAQSATTNKGEVLAAHGGRFVFGQVSELGRDKFLLDTQTGRLWRLVCLKSDEPGKGCKAEVLDAIPYYDGAKVADTPPPAEPPPPPPRAK